MKILCIAVLVVSLCSCLHMSTPEKLIITGRPTFREYQFTPCRGTVTLHHLELDTDGPPPDFMSETEVLYRILDTNQTYVFTIEQDPDHPNNRYLRSVMQGTNVLYPLPKNEKE